MKPQRPRHLYDRNLANNAAVETRSFTLDLTPGAPIGIAAAIEGSLASLSWSSEEADVVGYRVYRDGVRISASLFSGASFRAPAHPADGPPADHRPACPSPAHRASYPSSAPRASCPSCGDQWGDASALADNGVLRGSLRFPFPTPF